MGHVCEACGEPYPTGIDCKKCKQRRWYLAWKAKKPQEKKGKKERKCEDCGELFVVATKGKRFCADCLDKRNKDVQKANFARWYDKNKTDYNHKRRESKEKHG